MITEPNAPGKTGSGFGCLSAGYCKEMAVRRNAG